MHKDSRSSAWGPARRLRPLQGGRWMGSLLYDPPRPLRLIAHTWDRPGDLGLTCDHQGPHCPAWRERRSA
jgi:hypothetical protein